MRGGPGGEEAEPLGSGELRDGIDLLARELQPLAARDDELRPAEVAERRDRAGGVREQVLGVVEQQEHPLAAEHLREHVLDRPAGLLDHVERLRRVPEHERRVAQRGERDPPDAVVEAVRGLGRGLEREPGLAGAAGAGEREQADAVPEPLDHLVQLPRAAEELRRRHGEVRLVQRPRPRELARPELEEPLRRGEILEAVLAEVADLEALVEQVAGRAGEQRLPAVRRRHDPRRPVDVEPDVLRRVEDRLAGVDAHPDPDRPALERLERFAHRPHRVGGRREGGEEAVAGVVDLVAAVAVERSAQGLSVLAERAPVLLRPEGVEEPRRSLDVGEDERDRSGRLWTVATPELSPTRDACAMTFLRHRHGRRGPRRRADDGARRGARRRRSCRSGRRAR